jgi:O-acetyl-ADP-ribose deacetylase (regulator of RNase III)
MKTKKDRGYNIIEGNLIDLALKGEFEVIAHGCNCFCVMGAGIAEQMKNVFDANNPEKFYLEGNLYIADINKLGQIDFSPVLIPKGMINLVNCYTQYAPGRNLDYAALELCLKKISHQFKSYSIGLPKIGCGIAGGDWEIVEKMIKKHLYNLNVTVVEYK